MHAFPRLSTVQCTASGWTGSSNSTSGAAAAAAAAAAGVQPETLSTLNVISCQDWLLAAGSPHSVGKGHRGTG